MATRGSQVDPEDAESELSEGSQVDPGAEEADRELSEQLGRIAERLDPVPAEVLAAARGAFGRHRDSELLQLIHDSAPRSEDAPTPARRTLVFKGEALQIDLIVVADGNRRCLLGRIEPTPPRAIEVSTPDQTFIGEGATAGEFRVDDLAPGPVSIVLDFGDESELGRPHTGWVTV